MSVKISSGSRKTCPFTRDLMIVFSFEFLEANFHYFGKNLENFGHF